MVSLNMMIAHLGVSKPDITLTGQECIKETIESDKTTIERTIPTQRQH